MIDATYAEIAPQVEASVLRHATVETDGVHRIDEIGRIMILADLRRLLGNAEMDVTVEVMATVRAAARLGADDGNNR